MDKNGFVKDDAAYSDASKALTFLHMPPTKYHNPSLAKEEQEVTDQLYRGWLHYWNHESRQDFANGMNGARRFYDFEDMLSYDMFGNTIRGSFKEHFESIFPYWNDGHMEYKDFEVTALSKEYAFSTMIQHTWGTAGGVPFDTAFRRTGIARKNSQGEWKWIHEHLSFPTDMKTKQADFTASLDPVKATKLA
ncbi:SnoaL-like domain-containing protein [Fusarium keratoplasticum]|nr:SnoaL-like domain-containing protein [Fusarium keratoplasticum]